jgi:hypothetical protein
MARLFRLSCHPFQAGLVFQGLLVHHCCGLSGCSPPLTDLTGHYPSHEGFYIQAFSVSVSFLAAGYNYDSLWTFCRWDFHPLEYQLALLHQIRTSASTHTALTMDEWRQSEH